MRWGKAGALSVAAIVLSICLLVCMATVSAENPSNDQRLISDTPKRGNPQTADELFVQMLDHFKDGNYEEALGLAEACFELDPGYPQIGLYRDYLLALCDYLPKGNYREAYKKFSILAQYDFEDSEGYMYYSQGLLLMLNEEYSKALEAFNSALEKKIEAAREPANECWDALNSAGCIRIKQINTGITDAELYWEDDLGRGQFTVTWYPYGMESLSQSLTVDTASVSLSGLLPNTKYYAAISADEHKANGEFTTSEAPEINTYGLKYIKPTLDGDAGLPLEMNLGARKPTNAGSGYEFRMSFSYTRLDEDKNVKVLWVLHLDDMTCAMETEETLYQGLSTAWQVSLGELMDRFYENGADFSGRTVQLEVYLDHSERILTCDILVFR